MSNITPAAAKKLIKAELDRLSLPYTKLTSKTVSFEDLARASRLVVRVHGWQSKPEWEHLRSIARVNGFLVEAPGC